MNDETTTAGAYSVRLVLDGEGSRVVAVSAYSKREAINRALHAEILGGTAIDKILSVEIAGGAR
jgi:hypothetical protein